MGFGQTKLMGIEKTMDLVQAERHKTGIEQTMDLELVKKKKIRGRKKMGVDKLWIWIYLRK